jgi:hypothetical protein
MKLLERFENLKTGGQVTRTVKYANDLVLVAKKVQSVIERLTQIGR